MANKQFDSFIKKCEKVWDKMNLSQTDRGIITQSLKEQWWKFDVPLDFFKQKHIKDATLLFLANYYGKKQGD